MEIPNLNLIVETHIPITANSLSEINHQIRQLVLPEIRRLQFLKQLRWFSFLLHPAKQVKGCDPNDESPIIHLRLEPPDNFGIDEFINLLPKHFIKPHQDVLSDISGLDNSLLNNDDWALAWKIIGESSEWVLNLIENHKDKITPQQIVQFLHFITNPLGLGGTCLCIPSGFFPF